MYNPQKQIKMAKTIGFIGSMRGKAGNLVFCKGEKGMTYARAYQPQVANPKTQSQTDQRGKVNLVGRMSQVTPAAAIVSMGSNKRNARSEFNKNLLRAAIIDVDGVGNRVAKIAPEEIIFSRGGQALKASVSAPVAITDTEVTIGLTLINSELAGKYGERIVVAVVDPEDKGGYSMVLYKDIVFDNTSAQTVTLAFGTTIVQETMVCVYRCPFILTDGGASQRYESIANNGTDIIAKLLESNSSNNVRDWGMSDLAATTVFRQA